MRSIIAVVVTLLAMPSFADPLVRNNFIPAGSTLGDMWSFVCPTGGTFDLTIQTSSGLLDPEFEVRDREGNTVVNRDDTIACSNACAFSCPQALNFACAPGKTHYIIVQSASVSTSCPGGQYDMTLEVFDSNAQSLAPKKVKLGGGPKRKLPVWLDPDKSRPTGPVVDDGGVPGI